MSLIVYIPLLPGQVGCAQLSGKSLLVQLQEFGSMLSEHPGMHSAISAKHGVELVGTHNFINGQQNPSMHCSPVRHRSHCATDFFGVQSVFLLFRWPNFLETYKFI